MQCGNRRKGGFTLVEALVSVAIFAVVAMFIYQSVILATRTSGMARVQMAVAAIANEQIEIARNLPYGEVGLVDGWPAGRLRASQSVTRDSRTFTVETTVRNIDDPFDGTIGGSPNDTAPADRKLVEIRISCPDCPGYETEVFDTWIAPVSMEFDSDNGALSVRAFDANGLPVPGAAVRVENQSAVPPFTIDDTTGNDGTYMLVDVPPGSGTYGLTVSKDGYSTERTYPAGGVGNPNPSKPHATVSTGALTQVSFNIDRLGSLEIDSADLACAAVPEVGFTLTGAKLIGTDPDVPKYRAEHATDTGGRLTVGDLEWDSYSLSVGDGDRDLLGTIPPMPLGLTPGASRNMTMVVGAKSPRRLLVTVLDVSTKQPLTDVTVRLTRSGYDQTMVTGRGYLLQTDWVEGPGQADFLDPRMYFGQDGHVNDQTAGQVRLRKPGTRYDPSGYLTSSTFDLGTSSDFHQIFWLPQNQPSQTGTDSVRMQVAANDDNLTWDFVGPDGTDGTYYTLTDQNIWSGHDGRRYLRYRLFLQTANTRYTPTVSDVLFSFTAGCLPPGQVSFAGLGQYGYTLTVSKGGYSTQVKTVSIQSDWQGTVVELGP
ncbi:carboxypeptidase regulatory-like domain-containing protein [Candidatus Uhrbacteria bacterium]|nr:carboxypeptidase regulatory-like domain-containing protein [Candidatus Uhrbacteria bacterium]